MRPTDVDRLAAAAGCSIQYLTDTIKMLDEAKWTPGEDEERDKVVYFFAGVGIGMLEARGETTPVEHKIDTTKPGSVFDG